MSHPADIPDVIVKPVTPGRMLGGAAGGRARAAALLACLLLWVGLLLLAKILYLKDLRLDSIALLSEDTKMMISKLHRLDQQLTADLDLLDAAHPHFDY